MKQAFKIILIIIILLITSAVAKMLVKKYMQSHSTIPFVENNVKKLKIDTKLKDQFFPIGKFYMAVPIADVSHNVTIEGPAKKPIIIHHNFQITSKSDHISEFISVIITYSIMNTELYKEKRKGMLTLIYNDLSGRVKKYSSLLYKNDFSFKGFPGMEFGYIQKLVSGKNYLMVKVYSLNSEMYTLKVMAPTQSMGNSILSSFRLADS